jgi:hypothetical protein
MKRIALALFILLSIASAQTVSPLNSEHNRKKIRAEFSLTNDGFSPLSVNLEPMSLTFVAGKPVVSDLSPETHVKLSEYSARIGAKQIHTFGINASCTDNCAFIVFATMMTGHTNDGVAIATHIGSTFYACDKQRGCRQSFLNQLK